jgi:hypothetical protein
MAGCKENFAILGKFCGILILEDAQLCELGMFCRFVEGFVRVPVLQDLFWQCMVLERFSCQFFFCPIVKLHNHVV